SRQLPLIVEMEHTTPARAVNLQLAQQALALLKTLGTGQVALPLLDSAAGLANAAGITALSQSPGVASIHADAQVRAHNAPIASGSLVTAYPKAIGADRVWATGRTGAGVTVAVLDSGITPDPDLTQ